MLLLLTDSHKKDLAFLSKVDSDALRSFFDLALVSVTDGVDVRQLEARAGT
jgi:hypothetical protein